MRRAKSRLLVLLLSVLFLLAACGSNDTEVNQDNTDQSSSTSNEDHEKSEVGIEGGTLKIALDGQPPNLDAPTTPATSTRDTTRMMYETLLTTDENYQAVPMLAESIEISDDSRVYTFKLRKGVKFHSGKEMTSEDVIASMEYWLEKSTITGTIFEGATWESLDNGTVVLTLAESSSLTLDTLASAKMAAAIMPKEVIESAPPEGIQEYIGTGPYQFVEWKQDQYIHFKKFADYQSVDEDANGLAGKKVAHFDDVYFYIVPDASTRLAGLQTGEYDFAYNLPYDSYEQLQSHPDIETILTPSANEFLLFNKNYGPAKDFKIRQAINAALDHEEIMMAAFPNTDFFWLDSGYMDIHITNWASTAGSDYYNINDQELAKQYLEEAGYQGEELVILSTRDYDYHYNAAVVIHDQLTNIGINAVLDVYDWPTFNEKATQSLEEWDLIVISSSTVSTPSQLLALSPTFAGGVNDQKVIDDMKALETAPSLAEAQALWDDLQGYAWEKLLPIVNIGGFNSLYGVRNNIEGITAFSGPVFWNAQFIE